jgi:hypothetical protein
MDSNFDSQFLVIKGKRATWYRPTKLEDLLYLKSEYPHARIIVGNTEVGELNGYSSVLCDDHKYSLFFFSFKIQYGVIMKQYSSILHACLVSSLTFGKPTG